MYWLTKHKTGLIESYFSRKLPIEGNYGTVWRGPWGAGTFTEAKSCFKRCLASRSRLKSQTGHQVSKWWDSLQHLGPFKGSGTWKISKRCIKASQTPTDPPEPAIFTSKTYFVHQTTQRVSWPASGPDSSIFSPSHSSTTAICQTLYHFVITVHVQSNVMSIKST